jgi:hypothetical protein
MGTVSRRGPLERQGSVGNYTSDQVDYAFYAFAGRGALRRQSKGCVL